ncbi:TonB-dependent receptor [Niabella yanshanensis]|uniref:TonB-dependent receptor n=1 Tax=Niabella yanshanensis TaxID=577386 RepID=A0ABZ0WCM4_9BACT|nr:TonB-dependent receptor [Niabella yanshanensis]WQD40497.1 TonB-dependent receptor [Niabella yanshanensis]
MNVLKKYLLITLTALSANQYLQAQTDTTYRSLDSIQVITGQYAPKSLARSLYKVRLISNEQIKMRGATDLLGVLNTELGIRFGTDYILGETDIQIMGMGGPNVKILLDGVPLVDRGETRQSLTQININEVEKIEIVEGPMSVVYGTDALAGVINIITKKSASGLKNKWSVGLGVLEETVPKEYQAFNGEGIHNQNIRIGYNHKTGISASGNYARNQFGGWTGTVADNSRTKEVKPKKQDLFGGEIGYRKNGLNIWYRLNYLYEDINSEGVPSISEPIIARQSYITDRYTHTTQADWNISKKWLLNASASYQNYRRRTKNTTYNTQTGEEYLNPNSTQDTSTFKTAFFRATAVYKWSEKVQIQPGIEIKSDNSSGQRIYVNDGITDYSFFLSGEIAPVSRLSIRPGLRFAKNSAYDAPPVIPSLNLKYDLTHNWNLRASYGRGFRAPALRELYFTFHDASHDIEGNPDLKAEYSNSYAISISQNKFFLGNISASADLSTFYSDFRNRISYAQDPGNPLWSTLINIDKYKTTGGTATASLAYSNLQGTVGMSYIGRYNSYAEAYSNTKKFAWSPEINSNIRYSINKIKANIALFYKYTGKQPGFQEQVENGVTKIIATEIQDFHLLDLTANKLLFKYITINAGVKNLLDVTRLTSTNTSGGAHSSSGPILKSYGRSFFLGFLFNWN